MNNGPGISESTEIKPINSVSYLELCVLFSGSYKNEGVTHKKEMCLSKIVFQNLNKK